MVDSLETDKYLEAYVQPGLNQRGKESMDKPITSKKNKLTIKIITTEKSLRTNDFTGKFCQAFKN